MVLPFGLNRNGENISMNSANAPDVVSALPPRSYVDFLIVHQKVRYIMRCSRKSVLEGSVELASLVHASSDNEILVQNVEKNDFVLMLRFFSGNLIKFQDHIHAIKILVLSERFNCPDLAIHCIRELDLKLSTATVIDIYRALWDYPGINPPNTCVSGNETAERPPPFTPEEYGLALLHNTLQFFEMQAELVLATPQITELRFEELELIVKLEALQLTAEVKLFKVLSKWSYAECRRFNLEPNDENRCKVLGPLCLVPRYLLMTLSEFKRACKRLECLNRTEALLIRDILDGKKPNLTPEQTVLFEKFRTPRPNFPKMPIHLSDRSHPRNYTRQMRQAEEQSRCNGWLGAGTVVDLHRAEKPLLCSSCINSNNIF